jgi:inner membrane protein
MTFFFIIRKILYENSLKVMKRESHILIGGLSAYALNLPLIPAIFGSTLPDIDLKLGIQHRTWTHHALIIPLLLILSWFFHNPYFTSFAVGYISHLIADTFTPKGIPVWNFKKRISFNLCSTGSVGEYILVGIFVLMVIGLKGIDLVQTKNFIHLLPADLSWFIKHF